MAEHHPLHPEWMVLVNPRAGRRAGRDDWGEIARLLDRHGIAHEHRVTDYPRHAVTLIRDALGVGFRKFILVGGDGLLNEAVNGIFTQTEIDPSLVTVAVIPTGCGNDWARTFNLPFDPAGAIDVIAAGQTLSRYIGCVFYHAGGREASWYFINMCGLGFDAEVNQKVAADHERGRRGALAYRYHIFTTLLAYAPTRMALTIDGKPLRLDVFTMAVGIGQYNGGGMKQLPFAKPDDGLLDISVIQPITRLKAIRSVKKLYDGSFVELPEVSTYTGRAIEIISEPACRLEADGEALGESPCRFEICPRKLKMVIPLNAWPSS